MDSKTHIPTVMELFASILEWITFPIPTLWSTLGMVYVSIFPFFWEFVKLIIAFPQTAYIHIKCWTNLH